MPERTVGIVGLGLIGGSLARALVARGVRVVGTDRDPHETALAARCGVLIVRDAESVADAVPATGAVVLAVPLPALGTVAEEILVHLAPETLLLHAAGLQRPAATGLRPAARERMIGTHPLAGSHERGFAAARANLFAGATVWAEARADAATRARLEWLWTEAGARAVRYATAESHDAAMAWTSHLPQLASTALAAALATAGMPAAFGGPGLRDATRLAASPLALWRDLLASAPPETDRALTGLVDAITDLRAALASNDPGALDALWSRARAWRTVSPDAHDANPDSVEEITTSGPCGGLTGGARW